MLFLSNIGQYFTCAGFVNRVPEQAMDNLQKCLNVGHSPIFSSDFEHTYRKELRSNGSKSYSNGTGRSTGRNGSSSSASGSSSSSSNGVSKGGWLRGLFSSSKKDSSTTSSAAGSRQGQISGSNVVVLDPMGYYNVLGLKPNNQVCVTRALRSCGSVLSCSQLEEHSAGRALSRCLLSFVA